MNIYITFDNEQKLKILKDEGISMSGLINELLEDYFAKDKSIELLRNEASTEPTNTPPAAAPVIKDVPSVPGTRGASSVVFGKNPYAVIDEPVITPLEDVA